jgi:hypothetical protein
MVEAPGVRLFTQLVANALCLATKLAGCPRYSPAASFFKPVVTVRQQPLFYGCPRWRRRGGKEAAQADCELEQCRPESLRFWAVRLSAQALSDADYYDTVSDGVQALCKKAGVFPCVLDAAIFSSFDESDWESEARGW